MKLRPQYFLTEAIMLCGRNTVIGSISPITADLLYFLRFMLYCSKLDLDFTPERAAADRKMDTSEINAILTSLNKKGYFCQVKLLDNNGDFVDWLYRVSDTYHPEWIGVDPFEFVK